MPERDQVLDLLRELRDTGATPPDPEVLHARVASAIAEEIERKSDSQPRGAHRRRRSRRLAGGLVPVLGVLVVALVVAVFFGLRGSGPSSTASSHGTAPRHGSVKLVYVAEPTAQVPSVTRGALRRTIEIMQERLRALGIAPAHVSLLGGNEITVALSNVRDTAQVEQVLGTTAQLYFYDWEADALTPDGKIVADQLQAQDPTAIEISQGSGSVPSGYPGAGSMGLYQAVQLASEQRYWASTTNSRITRQYWEFGAPGSAACATLARDLGTVPVAGEHCLLSGPDDSLAELDLGLPAGVSVSQGQVLAIQRGWVVVAAIPSSFSRPTPITDPNAQFYVLKDNVALRGSEITNPQESTDPNGHTPDIAFGFSAKGKTDFQNLTAAIARRGALVSGLGQTLDQHFAVALGGETNQLITVPYIDYKQYPDGINGEDSADISGGFTTTSAQHLAEVLRLGALPLNLKLTCVSTPATSPCHIPLER